MRPSDAFFAQNFNIKFIRHGERALDWYQLLACAFELSKKLPTTTHYIANLATSTSGFWLVLLAAAYSKKTLVLPANTAPNTFKQLSTCFSGLYALGDEQAAATFKTADSQSTPPPLFIDTSTTIAHLSTSGTSGTPTLHALSWQRLLTLADTAAKRFTQWQGCTLLTTVPAQHMYGLEHPIFWPLVLGANSYDHAAQLPADIHNHLEQLDENRVLITTPFHLNACVQSGLSFPKLRGVLSSTAPLSVTLATQSEQLFQAPVYELYGSTETGAIATRQTACERFWQLLPELNIIEKQQQFYLAHPDNTLTQLHDHMANINGRNFTLGPRSNDLIKVAGKRASLTALLECVTTNTAISDAAFYLPEQQEAVPYQRLILFVCLTGQSLVTTTQQLQQIKKVIKQHFDPVFVPKEIYITQKLPRNEVGKLPKHSLKKLLEQYRHEIF